jgi:BON domain/Cytidylate kinase-like family
MTVIAMTQEMATLGTDVAQGLAKALSLNVVQHEVGDTVAERMELKRSLIRRVREGQAGWLEKRGIDPDVFAVYAAEEILTLAHEGIRVCAPLANRVEWLMERLDSDDAELAREEIERSDAAHLARTQQNFGVNLHDPLLYDLTLNTGRVSVESCVDQVIALTRRPEFQPTDASAAQLRNLALQARIRSALKANEATAEVSITTEANLGRVTLRGMVVNAKEREQTAAVIAGVDGVLDVDNQLRVMEFGRRRTTMRKF